MTYKDSSQEEQRRFILKALPVGVASAIVMACGGGGGGGGSSAAGPVAEPATGGNPGPATCSSLSTTTFLFPANGNLQFFAASTPGVTNAPFCIGQCFRQGDIPSGSSVAADIPEFQAVVKNRWPDGSVKFAILAGRISVNAGSIRTVTLSTGAAAPGVALTLTDLINAAPALTVSFSGTGSVALTSLLSQTSSYNNSTKVLSPGLVTQWISGPQMSSWIFRAPVGSDAHLVAWFEVRLWKNGVVQVLPWLENGYLLVSNPTSRNGAATVSVNGQQVFSHDFQTPYAADNSTTITGLPHHCRAALVSGGTGGYWIGTCAPDLALAHDTLYLQKTRLLPNYWGNTSPISSSLSSQNLPSAYVPMARLAYSAFMPQTGAAAAIGLLPKWDTLYLTSRADVRATAAVLAHGFAAGRFAVHYRDETTGRPARFSDHPNRCYNFNHSSIRFANAAAASMPAASGPDAPVRDQAHHPSMGFMAYLVTGLFYFMEETQFQATHNYFSCPDNMRGFQNGVLTPEAFQQIRSAAWSLRTLFTAAAVTPDDHPLRSDFLNSVEENVKHYHALYVAGGNAVSPLGYLRITNDYVRTNDGYLGSPIWQDSFFTAAWGWAVDMNFPLPADSKTKLNEFFAWKAKAVVTLLGDPADPAAYPFVDAGRYDLQIGTPDLATVQAAALSWNVVQWFTTGRQIWDATRLSNASATDAAENSILQAPGNAIRGGYYGSGGGTATGYLANLMPAIAYAVEHNVPGAAAGYARLTGASNWSLFPAAVDDEPNWGVRPRNA